jgi:putative FmdB family regulatory protein
VPVYEYKCKLCGEKFEVRQSINDKPLESHKCSGQYGGDCYGKLEKLVSLSSLNFKGSGWTEKTYK